MKYKLGNDGVKRANVLVRCQFTQDEIKRLNRVAKFRGTKSRYLLRSWLELIAEDELAAAEQEHANDITITGR